MTEIDALVIEDDPKLGIIYQTALNKFGFNAEIDDTGKNFKKRLVGRTPDLIILDIHLPYATGKDILEMIRDDENWKNVIVIIVTADLVLGKTLNNQADYVLTKPVSVNQIKRIIIKHWPHRVPPNLLDSEVGITN